MGYTDSFSIDYEELYEACEDVGGLIDKVCEFVESLQDDDDITPNTKVNFKCTIGALNFNYSMRFLELEYLCANF